MDFTRYKLLPRGMDQCRSLPTFLVLGLMFLLILLTYSTDILSGMQGVRFIARDRNRLMVEADRSVRGAKSRPPVTSIIDSTAVKVGNPLPSHAAATSWQIRTIPSNVSPVFFMSAVTASDRAAPSAAVTSATRRSTATSAMPPSSHSTIKTISKNTSLECGKLKELMPKLGSSIADDSNKAKVPKSVVTLVTAYYTVPSRHPRQHYMQWFKLFFLKIRTPIAFYTNCETLTVGDDIIAILLEREKMFPGRLLVRTMELEDPPLAQKFASVMKAQAARDPELSLGHNYRLSMIWLMKTDAMMAAIRENRFSSEWFLWVDAGAFRNEHRMKDWPSPERLAKLPKDRVLYELVYPFPRQDQMKGVSPQAPDFANWLQNHSILYYQDHLAAGFIGLNTKNDFHLKFYNTLTSVYQLMADHNLLIVKEQNVFNLMFLMYPQMFAAIQSSWQCGDGWFHAEPWLASQEEYPCKAIAPLLTIT